MMQTLASSIKSLTTNLRWSGKVLLSGQNCVANKPAKIEIPPSGLIAEIDGRLKITIELVAPSSRPLVIFIYDLDRCSPGKVSAVVEAINLFLAGEFEHCMFVLRIDDEVVAAALNKAHADVFAQMPAYARATSIGWRFMDKFVHTHRNGQLCPVIACNQGKEGQTHSRGETAGCQRRVVH